jgi:hypothetical protein
LGLIRSIMVPSLIVLSQVHGAQTGFAQGSTSGSCIALTGENICIAEESYRADVCAAIAAFSDHWSLPSGYFARLIWQESRFDPMALSPAGAQGIAQFMPATARMRGLANPFDPVEAMARSAEYLRFLELKFGNLGLAAAAYNGGEARIGRYTSAGGGPLPAETRDYVMIVTGHSVDEWLAGSVGEVDFALEGAADFQQACINMSQSVRRPDLTTGPTEWQPWGVLLAQNASAELARSRFTQTQAQFAGLLGDEHLMLISVRNPNFGRRMRFSAMVGRPTREEAETLCQQLMDLGGNCIVQRNGP